MKVTRLINSLHEVTQLLGLRNALIGSSLFHSTTTIKPSHHQKGFFRRRGIDPLNGLYRRISPVGDPRTSIVPILDQWVEEGRSVNKDALVNFIKELRFYKRYSHALEISMWMSDKRYYDLSTRDVAIRLDLMSKVLGIEQVEKYFDNIPQQLKVLEVYGALLNCYAYAKSVDKAEAIMQKMRDLGFAMTQLTCNVMLSLYYRTGNINKFNALMHEMEEKGIRYDKFTYGIQLSVYAAISDIEGMERTLTRMESDEKVALHWTNYAIVASGYSKAGLADKAVEMLKKYEALITSERRSRAYDSLISQYAAIGEKDEVLRIWELYQMKEVVYNRGYMNIMVSLLKFDDFDRAEKIFEEWVSKNLEYDIRVPNVLISAYSRKGLMDKAEVFVDRVTAKGGKLDAYTWYCLATGYLQNNQTPKALEMMEKAIVSGFKFRLRPSSESLASCLEYLKGQGDLEKAEAFVKLLLDNNIISLDVQERLLSNIRAGKSHSDTLGALSNNYDKPEFSEPEEDGEDYVSEEKCRMQN